MMLEQIEKLKARLQLPLPGIIAQMRMAPPTRARNMDIPASARQSGVMILLVEGDKELNTILIRRTEDGNTHSGQISFPGGKKDPNDAHIEYTALRECEEEIGILRHEIQVLGQLTPLYIPPSNFWVTPTVGFIEKVLAFKPSEREVQEIIKVPFSLLYDERIREERIVKRSDIKNMEMKTPVYALNDEIIIWGATAMILSELQVVLNDL